MPASKPRRSKRDPELVRRLDEVRQMMKVRRTEAERRAAATMDAVETYLHAAGVIRQSLAVRDQHIGELRRQIEQLEREHEAEAARWRARQASSVAAMRESGESDDGIGQLLELTVKQVRQLIAAADRAGEQSVADAAHPELGTTPGNSLEVVRAEVEPGPQVLLNVDESVDQSLA
ncbi:hypothetical protein ACFU44_30095 [Nocardia rhizosphaerihabitans]|uniref:hypothetical protein n=1 Tax=Nocardia rhizosphaerihabitans TaxID=1691570 RepID=UPI0036704E3C